MNTIPSIFKKHQVPYTVVGGIKMSRIRKISSDITILILNRGGKFFRKELFSEIEALKIGEIICVEGPRIPYDIEPLSREFQKIRFLLLQKDATTGEKINLGIDEARSRHILVVWSDMKIDSSSISNSVLEHLMARHILCNIPLLKNQESETIPSIKIPAIIKGKLKILPWNPLEEGMKSLYPFDYCGIYMKEKFTLTGGFDRLLANPYWQKLDFGFRSYLWGEEIYCDPGFHLSYSHELISEDSTADSSYKLFFLKNLAVRYKGDMGILPYTKLINYILKSDTGLIYSFKEFQEIRSWVQLNRYRFKMDAQGLLKKWQIPV